MWSITRHELLCQFKTFNGGIEYLQEIQENIVLISHYHNPHEYNPREHNLCELYDFSNLKRPTKFAEFNLKDRGYICKSAMISPKKLVYYSYHHYRSNWDLKILNFDATDITTEKIKISMTDLSFPSNSHLLKNIFSLNNNRFVIVSCEDLHFYDFDINLESAIKSIKHRSNIRCAILLKNKKILTVALKYGDSLNIDIWNTTEIEDYKLDHSISLRISKNDDGYKCNVFEKANGLLLITTDKFIWVVNPKLTSDKALVSKHPCHLPDLEDAQFIEDGHSLIISTNQGFLIAKFPIIKDLACEEEKRMQLR